MSSRLGQAKQLVPIDGVPLIQHAVDQAAPLVETVWVALGMHGDRFWQALREHQRVRRIQVMDSPPKLSASLRAVATAALADPGAQRLVVMLVDQFRVDTNWLRHMLQLARAHPEKVVASCYEGVRGVPALFPRVALEVLTSLKGDQGARAWLRQADDGSVVEFVSCMSPGDLDRPEDLSALGVAAPSSSCMG